MPTYSIFAYSHPIASGVWHTGYAYNFTEARAIEKQLANRDFVERTVIQNTKTGRKWENTWPRFAGHN